MDKLTLEHLAPYLPYGLKLITDLYTCKFLSSDQIFSYDKLSCKHYFHPIIGTKYTKPIMRPLSDIDKVIIFGNESFNPSIKFDLVKDKGGLWCDQFSADYSESPIALVPVYFMNEWLFKHHFDVFGLIDAGLAIDINTIKK